MNGLEIQFHQKRVHDTRPRNNEPTKYKYAPGGVFDPDADGSPQVKWNVYLPMSHRAAITAQRANGGKEQ